MPEALRVSIAGCRLPVAGCPFFFLCKEGVSVASQMNAPASPTRRPRVLVAKPGLDGHDRGAKVIAAALRDAGFEVVYTGLRSSIDGIVAAALQEDVDLIGLSVLSGAHLSIAEKMAERLGARGAATIPIVMGGVIPKRDHEELRSRGVAAIFGQEDSIESIVQTCRRLATRRGE